jgi:excisionase family DNA binding protein
MLAIFERLERMEALIEQGQARYLTTESAARRLQITAKHLENLRVNGGGPAYCKVGRSVRYAVDDLDAWVREGRVEPLR